MLDHLARVYLASDDIRKDQWGYKKTSVYKVCGRHILNVWRLMKSEMTLTSYTYENVVYHLLHDRYKKKPKMYWESLFKVFFFYVY